MHEILPWSDNSAVTRDEKLSLLGKGKQTVNLECVTVSNWLISAPSDPQGMTCQGRPGYVPGFLRPCQKGMGWLEVARLGSTLADAPDV
jgi:hypothetical protein